MNGNLIYTISSLKLVYTVQVGTIQEHNPAAQELK